LSTIPGRPDRDRARGHARRDSQTRPPRGERPAVDPAREAAYEAVAAVHRDDAYANLALPGILRRLGLAGRDAAFATELTYGTLRARGTLDAVLADAAGRDVERIDPPVRDALRLGAYQLLYTRVPAHAAVSSTVDMVRLVAGSAATGFANAVTRRVGERPLAEWLDRLAPEDRVGALALRYNHPEWIVRAFADALGAPVGAAGGAPVGAEGGAPVGAAGGAPAAGGGELEDLLAADNQRPQVHLCARPGLVEATELAGESGGEVGPYSPYAVRLAGGAPGEIRSLGRGLAHVQDEGSQLVALALANAPLGPALPTGPDERWLDLCAGPGGKAGLLGALAKLRGATVTAVEVAPHRAELVARAVRGLPVEVVCADGREVGGAGGALPAGTFDRVLVDAPCSGLGALRRRPESRWRRQPSELPGLTRLQRELLLAGVRAVRPGGLVGYVACSPHVVETRVTVGEAVRRSPYPVRQIDARPLLPGDPPELGDGPAVQLWPHRHGTDAMFLAILRREG
jgi:16S rRNA (cytosine967-C5)-methyltransferase